MAEPRRDRVTNGGQDGSQFGLRPQGKEGLHAGGRTDDKKKNHGQPGKVHQHEWWRHSEDEGGEGDRMTLTASLKSAFKAPILFAISTGSPLKAAPFKTTPSPLTFPINLKTNVLEKKRRDGRGAGRGG